MFQLSQEGREFVANQPEFGMGVHIVATPQTSEFYFIFDSKFVVDFSEYSRLRDRVVEAGSDWMVEEDIEDPETDAEDVYAALFGGNGPPQRFHPEKFEFFSLNQPISENQIENIKDEFGLVLPRIPFSPIPRLRQPTRKFDGFIRVSSFPDDGSIITDPNAEDTGRVKKNTYATTAKDFEEVPSGFSAVGRYALPNPRSARYAYTIVPPAGETIIGGTVQPAYGQSGGGVEVKFPDGLPSGSAQPRPYVIPTI